MAGKRLLGVGFLFALMIALAAPLRAQESAVRDPLALAQQLLGFGGDVPIPPPPPAYRPGDLEQFWVSKIGQDAPTRITAELAASTASIYLWVEARLEYTPDQMARLAAQLGGTLTLLRVEDNLGLVGVFPRSSADFTSRARLSLPDVDNDPHVSILFARDLREIAFSPYNPNHSLPAALAPGGYSNEREMLAVNTSTLPGLALHDPAYLNVLTRALFSMLATYHNPQQAAWLREALSWHMFQQLQAAQSDSQQPALSGPMVAPFLEAPNTGLMRLAGLGSTGSETAGQLLFLQYVLQRFGLDVLRDLFAAPGEGLDALDTVLERHSMADMTTGEPIRARDVFADFVMANILNGFVGDGRYLYQDVDFGDAQPEAVVLRDDLNAVLEGVSVNQFGTRYILLASSAPNTVTLDFSGQPNASRLPMRQDAGVFYWSGGGQNRAAALTRVFDLRRVESASLRFDAWYSLAEGWNYAYVQVSADGGATWDILPATGTSRANPFGAAYGPGFTGISNPQGPRPFPYLGIVLGADGITITEIAPDGPLGREARILPGDVIAGYDGQPWPGRPALLGWLATHEAGDTVNLYMQRGEAFFDVPVTLGEHPTRVFLPDALWLPQQADLTPYAGREILVRFGKISLPGREDLGFAVDNIAVPEIGFSDSAEGAIPGWTLDGWRQMVNTTPQAFLVQAAALSGGDATVQRLIGPGDSVTSGRWRLPIAANGFIVIAISGLNDDTDQPASFDLTITAETPAAPN